MEMRLDKYLAEMGIGTRSTVKEFIRKGRVCVGEKLCRDSAYKVKAGEAVYVDDVRVDYVEKEYYLFHKPAGCVTAVTDVREKTVMDYLKTKRRDLAPVGRLDKDTTGLLLITNDGELAHFLLAPQRHVDKVYEVWLDGVLTEKQMQEIEAGVFIEAGVKSKPAKLHVLTNQAEEAHVMLTIHEGRFHQVKRMFHAVGREVVRLKRTEFGPLKLGEELKPGAYRALTAEEIEDLKKAAQKKDRKGD